MQYNIQQSTNSKQYNAGCTIFEWQQIRILVKFSSSGLTTTEMTAIQAANIIEGW